MLLQEIFFPPSWLASHVAFLSITKQQLALAQAKISGTRATISDTALHDYGDATEIVEKLKEVPQKKLCFVVPNELIFYQTVTVPFLDSEKIALILPYELEQGLPFSAQNALFAFMVMQQDQEKKQSVLLVAATQKKHAVPYEGWTKEAKKELYGLVPDLFAWYSLYKMGTSLPQNGIVVDPKQHEIIVAQLTDGILHKVRTLALTKNNSQETTAKELLFTLRALSPEEQPTVTIVNRSEAAAQLAHHLSELLGVACPLLPWNQLLPPHVTTTTPRLLAVIGAGTSFANEHTNLLPPTGRRELLQYQLFAIVGLTLCILLGFFFASSMHLSYLETTAKKAEQKAIREIKRSLSITDRKAGSNLGTMMETAHKKIVEEKKLWFSFSRQTRFAFVKYLQALSSAIDSKELKSLSLQKLTIKDDLMTLQGHATYEDLEKIYDGLYNTKLFKSFTRSQEENFEISITLKQGQEEA